MTIPIIEILNNGILKVYNNHTAIVFPGNDDCWCVC